MATTASRLSRNTAAVGAAAVIVLTVVVFTTWSPSGAGLVAWIVMIGAAIIPAVVLWDFSRTVGTLTTLSQRLDETRSQAIGTAAEVVEAAQSVRRRRGWFRTLRAVWDAGRAARALAAETGLAPLARLAVPGYVLLAAASVIGVGVVAVLTVVVVVIAA